MSLPANPSTEKKAHWERVYSNIAPIDASWFQRNSAQSLRLIRASGLPKDAPVIDVGSGSSLLVDQLLIEGYTRLSVLDISARALDNTRRRLGEDSDRIQFIEEDVRTFVPRQTFALWHDRAMFHFLTDPEDRELYVKALKRSLAPGGYLILAAFAVGGPARCSGLEIVQYDVEKLLNVLGGEFELVEETKEDHVTPAGRIQKFAYFLLRRADGAVAKP